MLQCAVRTAVLVHVTRNGPHTTLNALHWERHKHISTPNHTTCIIQPTNEQGHTDTSRQQCRARPNLCECQPRGSRPFTLAMTVVIIVNSVFTGFVIDVQLRETLKAYDDGDVSDIHMEDWHASVEAGRRVPALAAMLSPDPLLLALLNPGAVISTSTSEDTPALCVGDLDDRCVSMLTPLVLIAVGSDWAGRSLVQKLVGHKSPIAQRLKVFFFPEDTANMCAPSFPRQQERTLWKPGSRRGRIKSGNGTGTCRTESKHSQCFFHNH